MKSKSVILITLVLVVIVGILSIMLLSCKSQESASKGSTSEDSASEESSSEDSASEESASEESDTISIETFSITNYQCEIRVFSVDKNVGEIHDKDCAIKIAKSLWLEKYDRDIERYIPGSEIKIAYDSQEDCWHIYNTTPPNILGGIYHAILRKNGEVIAIWAED